MTDDVVRATPLVDLLEVDDGAVVLIEGGDGARVLKVSAVARTILSLTEGGATLRSIGVELSARFGTPGEQTVEAAVSALVEELASQGLVDVQRGG